MEELANKSLSQILRALAESLWASVTLYRESAAYSLSIGSVETAIYWQKRIRETQDEYRVTLQEAIALEKQGK